MKNLKVEGMSCSHCLGAVTEALEEIGGKDIVIDLDEGEVKLDIDQSDDKIRQAIEDIGFDLIQIK